MPSGARRLRSRWSHALLGLVLSLGAPLGYLALRAATVGGSPTLAWLVSELEAHPSLYLYLTASTAIVLATLGLVVGTRVERLREDSRRDALTGLANLAGHRSRFAEEIARARRHGGRLSLLLLDVDRLKEINDSHGHAAGDETLRLVAASLRGSCRATDHSARIGGDEFVVLAVGSGADDARALAERIQAKLEELCAEQDLRPSVSIGIAELGKGGAEALRAVADEALYESKAAGRNRISVAPLAPMEPTLAHA